MRKLEPILKVQVAAGAGLREPPHQTQDPVETLRQMAALPDEVRISLRSLRLWHWSQYLLWEAFEDRAWWPWDKQRCRREGTTHIKAVQLLNDFFPIGDTADNDYETVLRSWA